MREEILKRKKRNRKILLYSVIFIGITTMTHKYYGKTQELIAKKSEIINGEIFSVNRSFLEREKAFYKDEEYKRKHSLLKKEWEREYEGVKFHGQSESKEQKYNLASTYESFKTPATN